MNGIIYLRVSTEEQAQSRNGIDVQSDDCLTFAEKQNIPVAREFTDEGYSRTDPIEKRPGLKAAIAALKKGDVLIVQKLDRLAAGSPLLIGTIEQEIKKRGARVLSARGEGTETDSADDMIHRRMKQFFSEVEVLQIRDRTRRAILAKRARGERYAQVPYGWRLEPLLGRVTNRGKPAHRLVKDPQQQGVIRFAAMLRAQGWPFRHIANQLNAEGYPSPNAGKRKGCSGLWSNKGVQSVLRTSATMMDLRNAKEKADAELVEIAPGMIA